MVNRIIRHFHAASTAPCHLLCFAHAGGGTGRFRPWGPALENIANVFTPVLAGRDERITEPALRDLHDMADEITAQVAPLLDRPIALAGISFGGLLAYEMAVRLQRRGADLEALFVASQRAPRSSGQAQPWHTLPDDVLARMLVRLGGLEAEEASDPEFRGLFLGAIRADLEAGHAYRPRAGKELKCPIFAWRGSRDPVISEADILGWSDETFAKVDRRIFAAGHFLHEGQSDLWLKALSRELRVLTNSRLPSDREFAP